MREWLKNLLTKAAHEMGSELRQMASHGSHESAALLFNGSAFVMYPRGTRDDPAHQPDPPQIEQSREM